MEAIKVPGSPKCILGESPVWYNGMLYFIDIKNGIIYSYDGKFSKLRQKDMVTFIVPAYNGLVFSKKNTINYINYNSGTEKTLFSMNLDDNIRFNDGKCDSIGRLFAGTMDINEKNPVASLYRIENNITEILSGITISNGTIWSPDGKTMYYIDSPTRKIRVFDYGIEKGTIKSERESIDVSYSPGVPDGMTIDSEGNLFVCFFGGSHVLKLDSSGKLKGEINVGAKNVSSCIFGGKDLNRLYITTAMDTSGNGGELFYIDLNITGIEGNPYKFMK